MSDTLYGGAQRAAKRLRRRHWAERRFQLYGLIAVILSISFMVFLFVNIIGKGYRAFEQTYIRVDVNYAQDLIDPNGTRSPQDLQDGNYLAVIKDGLRAQFPDVTERSEQRKLFGLLSEAAERAVKDHVVAHPELIGHTESVWLLADDHIDLLVKGEVAVDAPEEDRHVDDQEIAWIKALTADHRIERHFNWQFFSTGDSREPEQAGILGAVKGSLFTLLITLGLSFPVGVAAALYLEEFAARDRFTDIIEVNINNLAAVPSIVFGILGLSVFIQFFGLPRSSALVGGLVLTLMTLPTIIISSRAALKAVPPSIRQAAFGIGASRVQTVLHHVLPLALPGMLTGAIIGMSRALGETAPLLMIGMVSFVADVPSNFSSAATALPVQVYLWSSSAEQAFVERTSAAIMVLLAFLLTMNLLAVILRNRFERRW